MYWGSFGVSVLTGTRFNTLFIAFNMMLGLGESPIDSDFDTTYAASGGNPIFVKWIYVFYVAISAIVPSASTDIVDFERP